MRKIKWKQIITLCIPLIILVALGVYNYCTNEDFLVAPFSTCFSMLIAIVVSYYWVQKKNDNRKQKEIIINLLSSIQEFTANSSSYTVVDDATRDRLLSQKRGISNRIDILRKNAIHFVDKEDLEFIYDKFKEYDDFISEHYTDTGYLKKSSKELMRPLELINQRLFEVMLKLYR